MISLTVNGKQRHLAAAIPLTRFLAENGIDTRLIAVAVNGEVVRKADYASVTLQDGDVVEIVRMVGGG
ncbi:MAG TPA: sulfur carrier protein ThiS [Dehalococcoidia bacterium]